MRFFCFIISLALALSSCASPRIESVPATLPDAMLRLDEILNDEIKSRMKSGEIRASELHFTLGMRLRNQWKLWHDSPLANYFKNLGVEDPDAMSAIIIESYIRRATGTPLDIEAQIQKHKAEWDAQEPMRKLIKKRMEDLENQAKGEQRNEAAPMVINPSPEALPAH